MQRRKPMRRSSGVRIPEAMRVRVMTRDGRACVLSMMYIYMGPRCDGGAELDHVRVGGMGMKSVTCDCNLVVLCAAHHRYKTEHGREVRPILLEYLSRFDYSEGEHGHASR